MTKILKRLSAVILAAVVVVTSGTTAFALEDPSQIPGYGKADVSTDKGFTYDESLANTSFATQAACAAYYASVMAANNYEIGSSGDGAQRYSTYIDYSNVGSFYGYVSAGILPVSPNQVTAQLNVQENSKASVSYSFALANETETGDGKDDLATLPATPLVGYTYYGLLLKRLGFDSVGSTGADTERKMYGFIIDTAFSATNIVSTFFESGFKLLNALNPFQFFKSAYGGDGVLTEIANGADNTIGKAATDEAGNVTSDDLSKSIGLNFLSNARTTVSSVFGTFLTFAWSFAIPLSILFLIAGIFLTRNGVRTAGSKIKQVLIKCMFLVVGIPLLGASYTQILDNVSTINYKADDFIVDAVSKTFVDFERWVRLGRLDPQPMGSDITFECQTQGFEVSPNSWFNLRKVCRNINKAVGMKDATVSTKESSSATLLVDHWYIDKSAYSNNADASKRREDAKQLIQRYYNGDMYAASTFADASLSQFQLEASNADVDGVYANANPALIMMASSYITSFFPETEYDVRNFVNTNDATTRDAWKGMLGMSSIPNDFSKAVYGGYLAQTRFGPKNGDTSRWLGVGNIWNNGALTLMSGKEAPNTGLYYDDLFYTSTGNGVSQYINDANAAPIYLTCGLSTMSMYNYLCTDFTDTGLIVSYGAPSDYTTISHYSVNLIGANGLMRFAFAANLVTICFGYFFLAFFFVFRTLFETVFKGFELIAQALLSALGFYKSMGRCICIVINMIVQLLLTTILFAVIVDVMFGIAALFDSIFVDAAKSVLPSTTTFGVSFDSNSAQTLVIVGNLASSLVIIFYVSFMNRWRTAIVSSINGLVEECVGTLMGVNLQGASGMGNIVAGALQDTKTIATGAAAVGAATGVMSTMTDGASNLSSIGTSEFTEAQQVAGDNGTNLLDTPAGAGLAGADKEFKQSDLDKFDEQSGNPTANKMEQWKDAGVFDNNTDNPTDPENGEFVADGSVRDFRKLENNSTKPDGKTDGEPGDNPDAAPTSANDLIGEADDKIKDDTETLPRSDEEEPETGMHFDAATMGVVYTKKNKDGSYSDVGLGLNGITLGGTGTDGTKSSTTLSRNGIKSTQENEDGEKITSEASLEDGMTTTKTDAEGNVITTTTNAEGTTKTLTEKGEDGSIKTTTIGPDGTITVDTENAVTGYKSHRVSNEDGSDVTLTEEFPDGTTKTTRNNADMASVSTTRTDENGNEYTVTDTIDKSSNMTTHVESNGTTQVEQVLDENGEVVATTQRINNSDGGYSVLTTDADGSQTVKTYNAAGNVVDSQTATTEHVEVETNQDGKECEIHYGTNGEVLYTITEDGNGNGIVQNYKDGKAVGPTEMISNFDADTTAGDYTSNVVTLGDGSTREMRSYANNPDVSEMILTETDGSKRVVTQSSDSVNTVTYSSNGDKASEFTIDSDGRTSGLIYAANGTKSGSVEIDENGQGEYISYDSNGSVAGKAVIKKDNVVYTDAAGQESTISIVNGQPTALPNGMVITEDASGNRTFSSGGTTFSTNTDTNTVNSGFISPTGDSFNVAKNGSTGETTFKTMTDDGATTETTYNEQRRVVNLVMVDEVGAVSSQSLDASGYVTRSTSDVVGNKFTESYGPNNSYSSHTTYAMGGENITTGTINSSGEFTGTKQTTDASGSSVTANIVNNNVQNISGNIGGNDFKGVGGENGVLNIKATDAQGLYSRDVVVNVAGGEGTEGNEPSIRTQRTQPAMFNQFTNQAGTEAMSSESLYTYILGSMNAGSKIDTNSQGIDISSLGAGQGDFGENFFDNHGSATDSGGDDSRHGGIGGRTR